MTSLLRILKPIPVTDSVLTSSSVAEDDYPVWNAATAYTVGDRVIRTATHRIYERVVAGTTATAPENDDINWFDYSATNRWKMFDNLVGSQTQKTGGFTVTLTPGTVFNGVALINTRATSVRIKVTHSIDGVVFDRTITMQAEISKPDWWTYLFEPISERTTALALDVPTYGVNTTVEITLDGVGACGHCLVGTMIDVGEFGVMRGATVGIADYSRKNRNEFGEFMVVERDWNKRMQVGLLVPNNHIDGLQVLFANLRTAPTLWVGSEIYESMAVYGFYRDFSAVIAYQNHSQMSLEIEGLI